MDFSKVKSLTIPEGNVTQITDALGRVLWSAGPAIITFSLAYAVFQAEEGMTWAEWIDSEYNTYTMIGGLQVASDGYVKHIYMEDYWVQRASDGSFARGSEVIIEGEEFRVYNTD